MSPLRLLWLLLLQHPGAALEYILFTHSARMGSNTTIPCKFDVNAVPPAQRTFSVLWLFQDKEIFRYPNNPGALNSRLSLDQDRIKDGIADLYISGVSISDGGLYKCSMVQIPGEKEKMIRLDVYAPPRITITGKNINKTKENVLTCAISGFYPVDIDIKWLRDGKILNNIILEKPQRDPDGMYSVKSLVTIIPTEEDRNRIFSCRIQHESLTAPLQEDFKLEFGDIETSFNVVTVVCIILVLMTITVGFGICLWRRKYRKKDLGVFTVMDIEGPTKLISGEETSLYCKATNCPENPSVTWLEKRGGQVCEIPEFHGGDKEEEERLMDTQYGVLSCREGPNCTSSLKFRPSVANHKDVTFICRYSCGKEKKKKKFHCRAIYAKPQIVQPISRSLIVSEALKYLVTLENFYPRNITIRWTHGVEETQQVLSSTETFTEIPDGTYSVCSEVTIPEELLKDPEFRVRLGWEHESLDTPGYKDLSIRDSEYLWTPVVEEIQTPNVFHDIPVTLHCHISEYFPDNLTVTWLRKSQDEELCEETDNVVSSTITPRREDDNTYSCTASLKIVPTLSVHQGAEYICRVDHPSLERPIERKTEKLIVKAKPQMEEPIMITMGDSSRVLFTLNLMKFYPKNIDIEWTCEQYELKDKKLKMLYKNNFVKCEDLTYDVTSVGSIPMHAFNDLQTKVSVTWKHESLDEPETRTLTIRDLPWHPQVGEIIIPNLEEGKEACLICDISGYFPDHLKVSWCKKEPGTDSPPIVTELHKDDYKVYDQKEQKDKTFSYKSSLTFTPSFHRDQGAEFICRVEHPSLEKPIERTTGPIRIDLPRPQIGKINIPKLEEHKEATLTCDISGYFPDFTIVSWYRKLTGTDSHPIITPLPNDDFQVCTKIKDKTWQSSLTFTPSFSRDQGAEIIFRVEHPSLEKPIEKSTGPLKLSKNSMNGTVKAQQKASS